MYPWFRDTPRQSLRDQPGRPQPANGRRTPSIAARPATGALNQRMGRHSAPRRRWLRSRAAASRNHGGVRVQRPGTRWLRSRAAPSRNHGSVRVQGCIHGFETRPAGRYATSPGALSQRIGAAPRASHATSYRRPQPANWRRAPSIAARPVAGARQPAYWRQPADGRAAQHGFACSAGDGPNSPHRTRSSKGSGCRRSRPLAGGSRLGPPRGAAHSNDQPPRR